MATSLGGLGTAAKFNAPDGLTVDSAGDLIVCDSENHCIRKVHANGAVTTLAGSPPEDLNGPGGHVTVSEKIIVTEVAKLGWRSGAAAQLAAWKRTRRGPTNRPA